MNRNTHERVARVKDALVQKGMQVWFDEEHMTYDVDGCMASGIDRADAVVIFLTRRYCLKVNNAAENPLVNDNCYKEFSYATTTDKIIVPVIFEESMVRRKNWPPGIVSMHIASKMTINFVNKSDLELAGEIITLYTRLKRLSASQSIETNSPQTAPFLSIKAISPSLRKAVRSQASQVTPTLSYRNKRRPISWMWC